MVQWTRRGDEVSVCHSSPARDGSGICSSVLPETEKRSDNGGSMRKRRTPRGAWLDSQMGKIDEGGDNLGGATPGW